MGKLFDWIFAKSHGNVNTSTVVDTEATSLYRVQIKPDVLRNSFQWRVIDNATGYEPYPVSGVFVMNGTSYTKRGAESQGRKKIEELEAEKKNREQRWEDVDV